MGAEGIVPEKPVKEQIRDQKKINRSLQKKSWERKEENVRRNNKMAQKDQTTSSKM